MGETLPCPDWRAHHAPGRDVLGAGATLDLGRTQTSVCTASAIPTTINAQPSRSYQPAWRICAESCMRNSTLNGSDESAGYAHGRGSAAPLLGTIWQAE